MDFTPETLRKRFATLTKQYEAIDAERTALQRERDGLIEKGLAPAKERAYAEKIKKLHAKAAPIESERAMIARALGGQTGAPAE